MYLIRCLNNLHEGILKPYASGSCHLTTKEMLPAGSIHLEVMMEDDQKN